MMNLFSLTGRVALVTGASRGLGRAMAAALAEAGAKVVLGAREADALAAAVASITAAGGYARSIAFDVADTEAGAAAVAEVVRDQGRLDILVNNAGTIQKAPTIDTATADWQRVVDTNLTGPFALARAAGRPMVAQGWGRIISIGSVMSVLARPGIPAYVATKHALTGLTKALAVELGPHGVTANAIAPGYFRTDFTQAVQDDPGFDRMVVGRTPVGRWGEPADLAGTVIYLASDASAFVNGHLLVVDGGMTVSL